MQDDTINSTQSAPSTQNPQAATEYPGASNAEDFQSTAPTEALNQETDNLNVEITGEPNENTAPAANSSTLSTGWMIGIVLAGAVIVYVLYKLLKEAAEDSKLSTRSRAVASRAAASKKTSTVKKAPAKKKPAAKRRSPAKKKTTAKKKR